jgi:hypothetical protein
LLSMRNLNRKLSVLIILVWAAVCSAEGTGIIPTSGEGGKTSHSPQTISTINPSVSNKDLSLAESPSQSPASTPENNAGQPHETTQGPSDPHSGVIDSEGHASTQTEEQNTREIQPPIAKKDISANAEIERLKKYKNIPQIVEDEDYQAVEISLKDVTRVVCFTNITRAVYSKEKAMEIKTVDRNAFIKNLPKEVVDPTSGRTATEYDSRPKELYLVCGDKTFSLLLIPKDIPANTIYLKSSYVEKEKAVSFEKSNDYEDTILKLVSSAYFENIPDGYDVEDIDKVSKEYQEIRLVHKRNYTGIMFQVQEYIVIAKKELNINEITILVYCPLINFT